MNKEFEQILLGSMCGDGHIGLGERSITPHYSEGHCTAQKDYLLWKMNYFSDYMPKFYEYEKSCSFITKTSKDFLKYRSLFYAESNDKKLSEESVFSLNPLGLSIWYQDDGNYNYRLNTCNIVANVYSKEINDVIVRFLGENFSIKSNAVKSGIVKGRQRYYVYIYRNSIIDFLNIVKPYIHPSMVYKLGSLSNSNASKIEEGRRDRIATRKRWNDNNREQKHIGQKRYYDNNREKICAKNREYYALTKNHITEIRRVVY